ncbi:ABC transporter permease [Phaeobacter sp. J2-8]|uniref:ABC transporter permease n=1 Tax=Phaeobacter sp. J2-8 TaxID=2931394 RepID=UPI001FD2B2D1|nr:ABC transporter permease [Phaeobacter sp. J2-8]MCJ7873167.1 ABC transporter permease [Phaeobacter sp. J2-8]
MAKYILKRLIYALILLWLISIVSFLVIELPPGDYLTSVVAALEQSGSKVSVEQLEALRQQYGLDLPSYLRYFRWISGFLVGDFGYSFEWNRPVSDLVVEPLILDAFIAVLIVLVTYAIAIPIAVYSATHQYSVGDHTVTFLSLLGLATPSFLLALVTLYIATTWFGIDLTGLNSDEFLLAPWSLAKFADMLWHLPTQILIVSTYMAAGVVRVMRASLLDELRKQYVVTARAKGVGERKLLFKYPVRLALNPIISEMAMVLPATISAATVTAVVLGLPTAGPMLLRALISQDTFLSATILMFLSFLVIIGSTIADLLLVLVDPRIKLERSEIRG